MLGRKKKRKQTQRRNGFFEVLETRRVLTCLFGEGTFENTDIPMIYAQEGVPRFLPLGVFQAPVSDKYKLHLSFAFQDQGPALLKWSNNVNGFNSSQSFYSFGNGESISPALDAKTLDEVFASAGSLKNLTGTYGGVLMRGRVRVSATQVVELKDGETKVCSRDETFVVHRYVSASEPGTNRLQFGLSTESAATTVNVETGWESSSLPTKIESTSPVFSVSFGSITYNPSAGASTQYLQSDGGTLDVVVGSGLARTKIGTIKVDATRYMSRAVYFDKIALLNTVQSVFPFLSDPQSVVDEVYSKVSSKLEQSKIPIRWVEKLEDANVQLSFTDNASDKYGESDFEVPPSSIKNLLSIVSKRADLPIEAYRSQLSNEVVKLLATNKEKKVLAKVNAFPIQKDLGATASGRSKVESALSVVAFNQIAHSIGFIGEMETQPKENSAFDLLEAPEDFAASFFADFYTIKEYGSKAFLKVITGTGREVFKVTNNISPRPSWWLISENQRTGYEFAIASIGKDLVTQFSTYHDLDPTGITKEPEIDVENAISGATVVDFGNVARDEKSDTFTFKITNIGEAQLTISSIVTDPDFQIEQQQYLVFPIYLPPKAWITFSVTMNTATEGSKEGYVAISNNDSDEDPFNIFLKGFVTRSEKPGFLTVITHGWNPLQDIDRTYVSAPWVDKYKPILDAYAEQEKYKGKVNSKVVANVWDSGAGWNNAIYSAVVATVALAPQVRAVCPIVCSLLAAKALDSIPTYMNLAKRKAFESAQAIKEVVEKELPQMANPQVHLIGHSRGGAVVALASGLLSQTTKISQVTVLDGYATDWPNISSLAGDWDINNFSLGDFNVNYLVEQGLVQSITDKIFSTIPEPVASYLSAPDINALFRDWKAPYRAKFQENSLIPGYLPIAKRSNHINVAELYFRSGDVNSQSPKSYLDNSPLGRWNPNASGEVSGALQTTTIPLSEFASVTDFYDGSFDVTSNMLAAQNEILSLSVSDNPLFLAYQDYQRNTINGLNLIWSSQGDVSLVDNLGNPALELSATATSKASISQDLLIPSDVNRMSLNLIKQSSSDRGRLRVIKDGAIVFERDIRELATGTIEIDLPKVNSRMEKVTIEYSVLPGEQNGTIQIDDLRLIRLLRLNDLNAVPTFLGDAASVSISATGAENIGAIAKTVKFYIESNDVAGLQPETDRFVGESSVVPGQRTWTVSAPHSYFPFKATYSLYAFAESNDSIGPTIEQVFWVDNSYSPLTNQNNLDVNNDSLVSPLDALIVINFINSRGAIKLSASILPYEHFVDVNDDSYVTPLDILIVINAINKRASKNGEGEQDVSVAIEKSASLTDTIFSSLEDVDYFTRTDRKLTSRTGLLTPRLFGMRST
ncbi:MAG: dockerin type I domain-containing protein [Planctomycetota bacterium]|nr:dockerin type I domain-containing protein [Planctomycetota bacterium]